MPGIRPALSALAVAACGAVLLACGSDEGGTIPEQDGERLIQELNRVEDAVGSGDCDTAHDAALAVAQTVDQLPPEVEGELRDGLVAASANLTELTQDEDQCEPDTGATGELGTISPPEEQVEPPAEIPAEEAEQEPEEPEDAGGRNGGSQGGGGEGGSGGEGSGDDSSGGVGSDGQ